MDIYGFLIAGSFTMGTLGDRIGQRRLLLNGATAFGVTLMQAAFSTSPEMLIPTRTLLGVAAATLMPSTLALIRNMFIDPRQRTVAIGVWVAMFSAGTAIGPLLGGVVPRPSGRGPSPPGLVRRVAVTVGGGYLVFLLIVLVFHVWVASERGALPSAVRGGAALTAVALRRSFSCLGSMLGARP